MWPLILGLESFAKVSVAAAKAGNGIIGAAHNNMKDYYLKDVQDAKTLAQDIINQLSSVRAANKLFSDFLEKNNEFIKGYIETIKDKNVEKILKDIVNYIDQELTELGGANPISVESAEGISPPSILEGLD